MTIWRIGKGVGGSYPRICLAGQDNPNSQPGYQIETAMPGQQLLVISINRILQNRKFTWSVFHIWISLCGAVLLFYEGSWFRMRRKRDQAGLIR